MNPGAKGSIHPRMITTFAAADASSLPLPLNASPVRSMVLVPRETIVAFTVSVSPALTDRTNCV